MNRIEILVANEFDFHAVFCGNPLKRLVEERRCLHEMKLHTSYRIDVVILEIICQLYMVLTTDD